MVKMTAGMSYIMFSAVLRVSKYMCFIQNYFCQQMHCLLKHKMLQIVLKISLYMAPTCFGPSWTIIREQCGVSHTAMHSTYTLQPDTHIATAHQQF